MNRFATLVENASEATTKDVPSAGQATASPAEGEKNTKDVETNLQNELVDLLGIKVVEQYHNKKLLFDKYNDKMLKRRKSSKIINYDVITQKGPISLKVYREDETIEVIANLKVCSFFKCLQFKLPEDVVNKTLLIILDLLFSLLPVSHLLWSSQSFGHQKGACPWSTKNISISVLKHCRLLRASQSFGTRKGKFHGGLMTCLLLVLVLGE
ncbi:hypothetical protein Tco_0902375 [Tanacetum coccineum]